MINICSYQIVLSVLLALVDGCYETQLTFFVQEIECFAF